MKLKLLRPIVFFDLKATSTKVSDAKIVNFAAIKIHPNHKQEEVEYHFNPTGYTNSFESEATAIKSFLEGCDFAGFNITRFDLPLLGEEFARCGIVFPVPGTFSVVDTATIFHTKEPRDLEHAAKFYCGEDHIWQGYDAFNDAALSKDILERQIEKYDLPSDVSELNSMSYRGKRIADLCGLLYRNTEGVLFFNFGQNKDKPVLKNASFAAYMMQGDYPATTKEIIWKELGNDMRSYIELNSTTIVNNL